MVIFYESKWLTTPSEYLFVEKLECVMAIIQKCLGSHLCNLKHIMKGPLADGKTLGGKRLSDR